MPSPRCPGEAEGAAQGVGAAGRGKDAAGHVAALPLREMTVSARLEALVGSLTPRAAAEIAEGLAVVGRALDEFPFEQVALSFNGGKDCTVVLHLLRIALQRKFPGDESRQLSKLKVAYFRKDDEFPEMHAFMEDVKKAYGITVDEYASSYKEGLRKMEQEGTRVVLMGQRRTDPYGADLEHFTPCSEGWPAIVRCNPILDWSYSTIWAFLRGCKLEYCALYDQGYTSLGSISTTTPNPRLMGPDNAARPAYELENGDEFERCSRE